MALALAVPRAVHAGKDVERGVASWYGPGFDGRQTASGERFDKDEVSAAHRTLPFGTVVEIENLDNGRTARIRINDRGPFVHGRILDCSEGAARLLGFREAGTARIELRPLGQVPTDERRLTKKQRKRLRKALEEAARRHEPEAEAIPDDVLVPVDPDAGPFEVQVGAFRDHRNAERLAAALGTKGWTTRLMTTPEGLLRVRVGPFATRAAAEAAAPKIDVQEEPFVVRKDPER
jgi:rare lipoprotein A